MLYSRLSSDHANQEDSDDEVHSYPARRCAVRRACSSARWAIAAARNKDVAAKVNGEAISIAALNAAARPAQEAVPATCSPAPTARVACSTSSSVFSTTSSTRSSSSRPPRTRASTISDADIQKQIDQLKGGFKDQAQFDAGAQERGHDARRAQGADPQPARDPEAHRDALGQPEGHRRRDPGLLRQEQGAVLPEGRRSARATSSSSPRTRRPPRRCSSEIKDGDDHVRRRSPRSTRSTPRPRPRAATWAGRRTAYVPEFQAALDKLKKGEMSASRPVDRTAGTSSRSPTSARGTQQSLAEVKSQIEQIIVQQRKADAYQTVPRRPAQERQDRDTRART